jgi:hypothetical protein
LKVFFIYTCVLSFFVLLSLVSIYFFKSMKYYVLFVKCYTLFEYTIVAYFLISLLKNQTFKYIIWVSIPLFLCVAFSFYFLINTATYSTTPAIIEFLMFIVFIIYFFYEKMKTVIIYPLYQSVSFWICVAFFLYFTGNFFFFVFVHSSTDTKFVNERRLIYSLVTITKNILLCLALFTNENLETNEDELQIPNDLNLDEFTLIKPNNS